MKGRKEACVQCLLVALKYFKCYHGYVYCYYLLSNIPGTSFVINNRTSLVYRYSSIHLEFNTEQLFTVTIAMVMFISNFYLFLPDVTVHT